MIFRRCRYFLVCLLLCALALPQCGYYFGFLTGFVVLPVVPDYEFRLPGPAPSDFEVPALCGTAAGSEANAHYPWRQVHFGHDRTDSLLPSCRAQGKAWRMFVRAEACRYNNQFAGAVTLYSAATEQSKSEHNRFVQCLAYGGLHKLCQEPSCTGSGRMQIAGGYVAAICDLLPDLSDEERAVVLSEVDDRSAYELMIPLSEKFFGTGSRLHQYYVSRLAACEANAGNWQRASHLLTSIVRYHQGLHLIGLAACLFHQNRFAESAWCYRRWKSFGWTLSAEEQANWREAERACHGAVVAVKFRDASKVRAKYVGSPWRAPQANLEELRRDTRRANEFLELGELAQLLHFGSLAREQISQGARLVTTIPAADERLTSRCLKDLLLAIDEQSDLQEAGKFCCLFQAVGRSVDHMKPVSVKSSGGMTVKWGPQVYAIEEIVMLRNEMFRYRSADREGDFHQLCRAYLHLGNKAMASRALQCAISIEQRKDWRDYRSLSKDARLMSELKVLMLHLPEAGFWFGFADGAAGRQTMADIQRWQFSVCAFN